jgi:hypothetical protein
LRADKSYDCSLNACLVTVERKDQGMKYLVISIGMLAWQHPIEGAIDIDTQRDMMIVSIYDYISFS